MDYGGCITVVTAIKIYSRLEIIGFFLAFVIGIISNLNFLGVVLSYLSINSIITDPIGFWYQIGFMVCMMCTTLLMSGVATSKYLKMIPWFFTSAALMYFECDFIQRISMPVFYGIVGIQVMFWLFMAVFLVRIMLANFKEESELDEIELNY